MATLNSLGTLTRIVSGTIILINSDTLVNVVDGGVSEIEFGHTEQIAQFVGDLMNHKTEGKQRPSMIRLRAKVTSALISDALIAKLRPATSTGTVPAFTMTVTIPKYKGATGATTGMQYAFTACYVPEKPKIVAGAEYDTLEADIESWSTPAGAEVTIS